MASGWQAVRKQTTNPPRQAIGKDRQMVTTEDHGLFGSSQNESKTIGGKARKAVSTGGYASTSDMCAYCVHHAILNATTYHIVS